MIAVFDWQENGVGEKQVCWRGASYVRMLVVKANRRKPFDDSIAAVIYGNENKPVAGYYVSFPAFPSIRCINTGFTTLAEAKRYVDATLAEVGCKTVSLDYMALL